MTPLPNVQEEEGREVMGRDVVGQRCDEVEDGNFVFFNEEPDRSGTSTQR